MPALSLRANFAWNLTAKGYLSAAKWAILVLIARLSSPDVLGEYALALAIAAPVMLFFHLGLRQLLVTDTGSAHSFRDYLVVRAAGQPIGIAIIALIAAATPSLPILTVLAVGAQKLIEALSDICHAVFQGAERMHLATVSSILHSTLAVLTVTCFVYRGELAIGLFAAAFCSAAVLVLYDLPRTRDCLRAPQLTTKLGNWPNRLADIPRLARLARVALPLAIAAPLISLQANAPRYAVETLLGTEELGIYSALGYLLVIGNVLVMSLGQPVLPRLRRLITSNRRKAFRKLVLRLAILGATIGATASAGAWLFGVPVLRAIYGPEYAEHADLLVWLCAATIPAFAGSFLYQGCMAVRALRIQPWLFGSSAAIAYMSCILFIQYRGINGAAWGYGVAMLVQLAGHALTLWLATRRAMPSPGTTTPPRDLGSPARVKDSDFINPN